MGEKLILNDGSSFLNSNAIESLGNLYIYVRDGTSGIRDVFEAFIDPEKTAHIVHEYYGSTVEFDGYTELIAVRNEGNGLITAMLGKGAIIDAD